MSRLFAGVAAIALLVVAHQAAAQAPGRVDPVPPAPAAAPPPAPAPAAAPAPPPPAATTPPTSPDITTDEPDKPKAKKSTNRRHARYRYGYWGRPYYYGAPRYWWPFYRPRYHWRHHRRHYHGHFFWFRW
jgi:hypothetical protein